MRFANRRYQTRACRWPDIARLESEVSGKDLRDGRIVREPQLKRLYVARRHGASEVKFVGLAIAGVPDADLDAFRRLEASDHQIARGSIDVRRTLVEFNGGASRFGLCGACGVARQRREQAAIGQADLERLLGANVGTHGQRLHRRSGIHVAEPHISDVARRTLTAIDGARGVRHAAREADLTVPGGLRVRSHRRQSRQQRAGRNEIRERTALHRCRSLLIEEMKPARRTHPGLAIGGVPETRNPDAVP